MAEKLKNRIWNEKHPASFPALAIYGNYSAHSLLWLIACVKRMIWMVALALHILFWFDFERFNAKLECSEGTKQKHQQAWGYVGLKFIFIK